MELALPSSGFQFSQKDTWMNINKKLVTMTDVVVTGAGESGRCTAQ